MVSEEITRDERKTLSVLAFLLFRMGQEARAKRIYEAIAELSEPGSADWRLARAGVAAIAVETGDGTTALAALRDAMKGASLSTRDAALWLLKARALWMQGRREEAKAARDEFLYLTGEASKAAHRELEARESQESKNNNRKS